MSTSELQNKTVIVTGAASGIGRRVSERLMVAGAKVIALDKSQPTHSVSRFIAVDLSDSHSINVAIEQLGRTQIYGLCNIAGVPGTMSDEMVACVNYLGLKHLTAALLPLMVRGGAIVNLASVAGSLWRERVSDYGQLAKIETWEAAQAWIDAHPFLKIEAYRRFKEALIVWTQLYAGDWMQRFGVRMNCVSPGPVDTPILDDFRESHGRENVANLIQLTGRPGTTQDIASVVIFLLTDSSRWIVGTDVVADGGMSSSRFRLAMDAAGN